MTTFSRLEARDILAHVAPGIDPDVLAKLQTLAETVTATVPTVSIVRADVADNSATMLNDLEAARAKRTNLVPPPTLTVLDERMKAKGFTQEDVDVVNTQRQAEYATYLKMQNRVPIVGEQNADNINADFAPPDTQYLPPSQVTAIGALNRAGDPCIRPAEAGQEGPVFQCKRGHAYNESRSVAGCPQCFIIGGDREERGPDPDAIPGEETF